MICAALLVAFAAISYSAAITKSATFDENVHLPAGYTYLKFSDFRVNPEHPPLWKYWEALPLLFCHMEIDRTHWTWRATLEDVAYQWNWAVEVLYHTPANDADRLLRISRAMMLVFGIALAALIAWWSWRVAGAIAAIVATTLVAFDPNFMAHASLVHNDVAFSLAMLALSFATWRAGQHATWRNVFAVTVLCGVAIVIKFSGLLLGPILLILLLARAIIPQPWPFLRWTLSVRRHRIIAAICICVAAAFVSYGIIWATYQFRFRPVPQIGSSLNMDELLKMTRQRTLLANHPGEPVTSAELLEYQPAAITQLIVFAEKHQLFPQAFLFGILHVHMESLLRDAYLMGKLSPTGWWYYFPLAMSWKTPIATIVAALLTLALIIYRRSVWWKSLDRRWLAICLSIPPLMYAIFLMRSNMNIGLRHMFPAYPPTFIAIGACAAHIWRRSSAARISCAILALVLVTESLSAYPNFIPFFNIAAGGSRNGINLLVDSNFDWGQDLKPLAKWYHEWRVAHPDQKFYLCYFGIADPAYYKIDFVPLPGGYALNGMDPQLPADPGVVAISATRLRIYDDPKYGDLYRPLRDQNPIAIIGGSIYIYNFPPSKSLP